MYIYALVEFSLQSMFMYIYARYRKVGRSQRYRWHVQIGHVVASLDTNNVDLCRLVSDGVWTVLDDSCIA